MSKEDPTPDASAEFAAIAQSSSPAPIRDEEGVWRDATFWRPDGQPVPGTEPPGAVELETHITLPSKGRVAISYGTNVIRREVLNAGTRVGITFEPTEPAPPPPPPVIEISDIWFDPSTVKAGEETRLFVRLSGAPGPTDLAIDISGPPSFQFPALFWVRAGQRENSIPIKTAAEWVSGAASFTAKLDGRIKIVHVTVTAAPPPPPPVVTLAALTLAKTTLKAGESTTGKVELSGPATSNIFIAVGTASTALLISQLAIAAGQSTGSFTVTVTQGAAAQLVRLSASHGGVERTANLQILSASPGPIGKVIRIDAPKDGVTRADLAIQQQWALWEPGTTFVYPKGDYLCLDSVKIHRGGDQVHVGEPGARILHRAGVGFQVGNGGQPFERIEIAELEFVGYPGKYMRTDGNTGHAIQVYGPKGTIIRDCIFRGPGAAVQNVGSPTQTYGTQMINLFVDGWGGAALFCNGGERIKNCRLIQTDPAEFLQNSSHGIYVHSGCNDVRVEDTLIERARKYGLQLYGQDPGTTISGVYLKNLTMRSCANGLTIQQSAPDRARVKNLKVENLVCEDIYGGPCLSIKQGDEMHFTGCRLSSRPGNRDLAGLQLGVFAPYEPGFWVSDLLFENGIIENAGRGFWALQSFGGRFENCRVRSTEIRNCVVPAHFETWQGQAVEGVSIEGYTPV